MRHRNSCNTQVRLLASVLLATVLITPACAKKSFYRITDLTDGSVFYTKDFNPADARDTGIAKFVDAHSAALIRLKDYQAQRISKREFSRVLP